MAHLLGILNQVFVLEDLESGIGSCGSDSVAAVCSTVRPRSPVIHDFLAGYHGTDRHTRGNTLGDRHDVRLNSEMLKAPHLAGTAHTSLNFIEDEHDAVLVAECPDLLHPAWGWNQISALASNRFDEDGGDVIRHDHRVEEVLELVVIGEIGI